MALISSQSTLKHNSLNATSSSNVASSETTHDNDCHKHSHLASFGVGGNVNATSQEKEEDLSSITLLLHIGGSHMVASSIVIPIGVAA